MHFEIEQRFTGALDVVERALSDPAFLARLAELPKLGRPTLLEQQQESTTMRQRVRYAFVGELSGAVRAVVDPARLTWVEESTIDHAAHRTEFRIVPDHYGALLRCWGTFELHDANGAGCTRVARGEVEVSVPLFARKVESAIVSGLAEHAELEADVLDDWLIGH